MRKLVVVLLGMALLVAAAPIALASGPFTIQPGLYYAVFTSTTTGGALPMIGLYVLFLLKLLSKLSWIMCIVFAAATAAGGYVIFDVLLGIPLPGGMFF